MSELLNRVFPPEQCIPDKTFRIIEEELGVEVVDYLTRLGPHGSGTMARTHLQAPFIASIEDLTQRGVALAHPDLYTRDRFALAPYLDAASWQSDIG